MQLDAGAPVDGSAASGKTIWFISPDQSIPYVADQAAAVQEAGESIGVTVKVFDGKSTPDLFNQGFTTALSQGAAGIILNSIDPALVPGPLEEAKNQGVPVIDTLVGLPGEPVPDGVAAILRTDTVGIGRIIADQILSLTGCETNTLNLTTSVYPFNAYQQQGIEEEFAALCPECKLASETIDPTKIATSIGPLVTNGLTRDPEINSVIAAWTSLVPYIIPSVEQKGLELPIVSSAGTDADFDQIRQGSLVMGNVALPPASYFGYLQFDAILRAILNAEPANTDMPVQLITENNVGADNELTTLFPGIADYKNVYTELWKG